MEGTRPDVAVLVRGLATSSWHWRDLARHPLLRDGAIPSRASGDGYTRFTQGAVERARGHVEIVSETELPLSGTGFVVGSYVALPSGGSSTARPPAYRTGERLAAALANASRHPSGDGDQVQALLRMDALRRAERFYLRGNVEETRRFLAEAVSPDMRDTTALVADAIRPIPTVAYESTAVGRTAEDAVRRLASLLWASGRHVEARSILAHQLEDGDPMALLQLAWIEVAEGRASAAAQAIDAYLALPTTQRNTEVERLQRVVIRPARGTE